MKILGKTTALFLIILFVLAAGGVSVNSADQKQYYSPFNGISIKKFSFQKAVMAVIENTNQARPQAGLNSSPIVYEYLVEGGITRFLALYWDEIPNKIGPIRSARPYLIETAQVYNSLLLHAGASPEGFHKFQTEDIEHLDQIYNGNYYWRGSTKKPPHNLYTGYFKISDYLKNMTGQEYQSRFNFKQISFINYDELNAEEIIIDYWGNYDVRYRYNMEKNNYKRYIYDFQTPHLTVNNEQIEVDNIIVKFANTEIKDDLGRLEIEINGTGKAYYFHDGILTKGKWEKKENQWTQFYNQNDKLIEVNPGKTWIQVIPKSAEVIYRRSEVDGSEDKRKDD